MPSSGAQRNRPSKNSKDFDLPTIFPPAHSAPSAPVAPGAAAASGPPRCPPPYAALPASLTACGWPLPAVPLLGSTWLALAPPPEQVQAYGHPICMPRAVQGAKA
eukprot:1158747-Pelagomonas_calceolata.AAC.6